MALKRTSQGAAVLHSVQQRAHPRDREGLLVQLRGGDAEARRWAARDLAQEPEVAGLLGSRLLDEPDAGVRQALFTALASIGDRAAAQSLLPLLRSEDAMLRNSAIEALAAMPNAVEPFVAAQLIDDDSDVRIFAVNLLAELQHPRAAAWASDVLARDTEVNVVAAAVEVLAEIGSPEHAPALRSAGARFAGNAFIGFAVEMAVQRIEVP